MNTRHRTSYWSAVNSKLNINIKFICKMTDFCNETGLEYASVISKFAKARKEKQSSITFGDWEIKCHTESMLKQVFEAIKYDKIDIVKPEACSTYYKYKNKIKNKETSLRFEGRQCFH